MTTFGELIGKVKEEDVDKIRDVMKWTLNKTWKDTITEALIKKVKKDLNALDYKNASNTNEMASIGRWADKYQTFINYATKGGKRKRRKRSKKGGFMLLAYGAYKMYNHFSNKKGKKRRKKTRKRKKGGRKRKRTRKR